MISRLFWNNSLDNTNEKDFSKSHWIYIFIATILYGCIWSYIGIIKILSLNAYVFDLGINSERGWQILHNNLSFHGYLTTLINSGIVYPLSPLTGSGNFFTMIIFQSFSIAIVGPVLYVIAKKKGLSSQVSILLTLVYFLYFPIYGIMWFDFHYQIFFVPLFMLAYYFYIRKNYGVSTLLFFLSGTVRFPYSIFPLSFAFTELVIIFRSDSDYRHSKNFVFMSFVLIITLVWTVLGIWNLGFSNTIPHGELTPFIIHTVSIWSRFFVVSLFLGPLLFLPAFKVRWIVMTFPAFFLFLTSSYTWYTYPYVFQGQYVAGVIPFLFIGLIDFLKKYSTGSRNIKRFQYLNVRIRRKVSVKKILTFILIFLLFLNIFYAPFGPLNSKFGDQFSYNQNTSYSISQYTELHSMVNMIPAKDPYVIYQNNLPEILPRPLPQAGSIAMGGYLGSLVNITPTESIDNSWTIYSNGHLTSIPIDYAIADAKNPNFYLQNNSMYSIVENMYASGHYGILSEGHGLVLLEHGYIGTIQNFVPQHINISGSSFLNDTLNEASKNNIVANTTSSNFYYNNSQMYLFPGAYVLTLRFSPYAITNYFNDSITFQIYSGTDSIGIYQFSISNTSIKNEISISLNFNSFYGNICFQLNAPNTMQKFPIDSFSMEQIKGYNNVNEY